MSGSMDGFSPYDTIDSNISPKVQPQHYKSTTRSDNSFQIYDGEDLR